MLDGVANQVITEDTLWVPGSKFSPPTKLMHGRWGSRKAQKGEGSTYKNEKDIIRCQKQKGFFLSTSRLVFSGIMLKSLA